MKVKLTQIVKNSRGIEGHNEETAAVTIDAKAVEEHNNKIVVTFDNEEACLNAVNKINAPYGKETYPCLIERRYSSIACTPFAGSFLKVDAEDFHKTI